MCSIMGYCRRNISVDTFMKGFQRTKSRGQRTAWISQIGNYGTDTIRNAAVSVWK